jgi:hypothetical protein
VVDEIGQLNKEDGEMKETKRLEDMTLGRITAEYNKVAGELNLEAKRFKDKASALKRLSGLLLSDEYLELHPEGNPDV